MRSLHQQPPGAAQSRWTVGFIALLLASFLGIPSLPAQGAQPTACSFVFSTDTFAFENELVWQYVPDLATGRMIPQARTPKPAYTLRCFAMVRAARQFYDHARFDPEEPKATPAIYRHLVRLAYARNPRRHSPDHHRIVIPGYADLREFSRDYELLLKAEGGPAWHSFVQRGNWRMIFPFSRGHQQRTAERLVARMNRGRPAAVHVVTFPSLTINHALLAYGASATPQGWRFTVYDPNELAEPMCLDYDGRQRQFHFPASKYFAGGTVKVYEIYRGLLY